MLIYAFCKICEREIVLVTKIKSNQNNFKFTRAFANLTKHVRNLTNCCITVRKYESVSYSFSRNIDILNSYNFYDVF